MKNFHRKIITYRKTFAEDKVLAVGIAKTFVEK